MRTFRTKLFDRLVPPLYEDSDLLIVNKPAGIDVSTPPDERVLGIVEILNGEPRPTSGRNGNSGTGDDPGAESDSGTWSSSAETRLDHDSPPDPGLPFGRGHGSKPPPVSRSNQDRTRGKKALELIVGGPTAANPARLESVNRLSRYDSGVLILSKNGAVARRLRAAWRGHRVEQQYLGLVRGTWRGKGLTADPVAGSSKGKNSASRSARSKPREKTSRTVGRSVRRTTVSTVRTMGRNTLVGCRTTVESIHALRAQLRSLGHPLEGDQPVMRSSAGGTGGRGRVHLAAVNIEHPTEPRREIKVKCERPADFDSPLRERSTDRSALQAALVRRLPVIEHPELDAYRLISGHVEDLSGIVAERFGETLLLQVAGEQLGIEDRLRAMGRWYRDFVGVSRVYVRSTARDRTAAVDQSSPWLLLGEPSDGPESFVSEYGLRFEVHLDQGSSAGLFPDQRDNRRRVRGMADGADVLNLFAFTGSFSVAAAVGGARETISVDLSARRLEWARRNFQANGVDPDGHRFVEEDALAYLRRVGRRGRRFDLVVVDPPTFAHGHRGRDFWLTRDLPQLINLSLAAVQPGGVALISSNMRGLSHQSLRRHVRAASTGRRIARLENLPLPLDFAMDPDHAKSILVQVE